LNEDGKPAISARWAELNESIKTIQEYNYPFERPEKFGGPNGQKNRAPGRDDEWPSRVLAKYSDEPDWGMDYELFDEYPELRIKSVNMGGRRKALRRKLFRHMYWPAFTLKHAFNTFKIGARGLTFEPMGRKLTRRAQIFLKLRQKKPRPGTTAIGRFAFWPMRFTTWRTARSPFTRCRSLTSAASTAESKIGHEIPLQVTHIVAYYHFSLEDYIARLMHEAWTGEGGSFAKEGVAFETFPGLSEKKTTSQEACAI